MACTDDVHTEQTMEDSSLAGRHRHIEFVCRCKADCMQTEHMQTHIHTRNVCMGIPHCAMKELGPIHKSWLSDQKLSDQKQVATQHVDDCRWEMAA